MGVTSSAPLLPRRKKHAFLRHFKLLQAFWVLTTDNKKTPFSFQRTAFKILKSLN